MFDVDFFLVRSEAHPLPKRQKSSLSIFHFSTHTSFFAPASAAGPGLRAVLSATPTTPTRNCPLSSAASYQSNSIDTRYHPLVKSNLCVLHPLVKSNDHLRFTQCPTPPLTPPHPPTTTTSSCTATPPPASPATYGCCKNCRSRSTTRSPPFLATTTTDSTPIEKCRSSKSPPRTTTTTNTPSPCTKAWPSMCTCCGGTRLGLPWHPPPPKNGRNCTNGACGP